jgi:hypothetical protein
MGFKSRLVPSFEVFRADGHHCRGFLQKPVPLEAEKVVDMPRSVKRTSRFLWEA